MRNEEWFEADNIQQYILSAEDPRNGEHQQLHWDQIEIDELPAKFISEPAVWSPLVISNFLQQILEECFDALMKMS